MGKINQKRSCLDELAGRHEDPNHLYIDEDPPISLILSEESMTTLLYFADQIIPKTKNNLSASDAGFALFLKNAFKNYYDFPDQYSPSERKGNRVRRDIEKIVYALDYIAQRDYGESFTKLVENTKLGARATVTVANVERLEPKLFGRMRLLVIQSYFSDPRHGGNKNFSNWNAIRLNSDIISKTNVEVPKYSNNSTQSENSDKKPRSRSKLVQSQEKLEEA